MKRWFWKAESDFEGVIWSGGTKNDKSSLSVGTQHRYCGSSQCLTHQSGFTFSYLILSLSNNTIVSKTPKVNKNRVIIFWHKDTPITHTFFCFYGEAWLWSSLELATKAKVISLWKPVSHVYKHCSIIILNSLAANFLQFTSLTLSDAMSSLEFNYCLFSHREFTQIIDISQKGYD